MESVLCYDGEQSRSILSLDMLDAYGIPFPITLVMSYFVGRSYAGLLPWLEVAEDRLGVTQQCPQRRQAFLASDQ